MWRPGHPALNTEPRQQPPTGSPILGAAIKAVRTHRGKTMLELAAAAGCSKATVAHIESGKRAMTKGRLEAFQKALRCKLLGVEVPEWAWSGRVISIRGPVRIADARSKKQLYPATSASNRKPSTAPVTPAIAAVTRKKRRAA